jgi:hypothetical protein
LVVHITMKVVFFVVPAVNSLRKVL